MGKEKKLLKLWKWRSYNIWVLLLIREVNNNILRIILEGEIFREKNDGKKADILDWKFEEVVQLVDITPLQIS